MTPNMDSTARHDRADLGPALPHRRRAFTLTEMLITVAIIAVLAAILIPVALRATRTAALAKLQADLQAIGQALEAYRSDHGDYPRLNPFTPPGRLNVDRGSIVLTWALLGPYPASASATSVGDGADGYGFRTRPGVGRVYGPYLQADRFRLVDFVDGGRTYKQLADGYGTPILYYPAKPGPRVGPQDARYFGLGDTFTFNPSDNPELAPGTLLARLQQAQFTGPFVLYSAGPDQVFGTKDDVTTIAP